MINKTQQQQEKHSEMLADCKNILEKHGVTAILTGSALLGIKRDGDLIPWCPGVVLSVFCSEIKSKEMLIIKDFEKNGFTLRKHRPGPLNYKIRIDKYDLNVEIVGYAKNKDYYFRKMKNKIKVIPFKFMDELEEIQFRGEKYKIPGDVEGFLNFIYRNWKVPDKSKAPSAYKSPEHMRIMR